MLYDIKELEYYLGYEESQLNELSYDEIILQLENYDA